MRAPYRRRSRDATQVGEGARGAASAACSQKMAGCTRASRQQPRVRARCRPSAPAPPVPPSPPSWPSLCPVVIRGGGCRRRRMLENRRLLHVDGAVVLREGGAGVDHHLVDRRLHSVGSLHVRCTDEEAEHRLRGLLSGGRPGVPRVRAQRRAVHPVEQRLREDPRVRCGQRAPVCDHKLRWARARRAPRHLPEQVHLERGRVVDALLRCVDLDRRRHPHFRLPRHDPGVAGFKAGRLRGETAAGQSPELSVLLPVAVVAPVLGVEVRVVRCILERPRSHLQVPLLLCGVVRGSFAVHTVVRRRRHLCVRAPDGHRTLDGAAPDRQSARTQHSAAERNPHCRCDFGVCPMKYRYC
eukprot:Rhum_TRINITY_DN15158_c7_g1::Rhum_TRINITY_DN15158_c7_g1_i6::g.141272::m.141272